MPDPTRASAPWLVGTTRTGSLAHIFPSDRGFSVKPTLSICGMGRLDEGRKPDGLPICAKCESWQRCETCHAKGPYAVERGWWHDRGCPLFQEEAEHAR